MKNALPKGVAVNFRIITRQLLVDGAGTFLAIYIIMLSSPVVFQRNEVLGLLSLFITTFGTRVFMQKVCSFIEWLREAPRQYRD